MLLQVQEAAAVALPAHAWEMMVNVMDLVQRVIVQLLPVGVVVNQVLVVYIVALLLAEEETAVVVEEEVQEGAVHHRRFAAMDRSSARKW